MSSAYCILQTTLALGVIIVCARSPEGYDESVNMYVNRIDGVPAKNRDNSASYPGHKDRPCPCKEIKNCDIITTIPQKEVFAFSVNNNNWQKYDWSRVTTVVSFGGNDDDLMCYAHSKGVRVLSAANIRVPDLTNDTARHLWVQEQLDGMRAHFIDGINVDFESAIEADRKDQRDGLTRYMTELNQSVKKHYPTALVTIDYAWSSEGIDSRFYDYRGIADVIDIAFIMSYDERSQIRGDCVAWANSGFNNTLHGVQSYMDLGIPAHKLVVGVPWYGYRYPCTTYDKANQRCAIRHVPFRGVGCSDAAGGQLDYSAIINTYLPMSFTSRLWDETAQSPYFSIKDPKSGQVTQFWYDDPESLSIKYKLSHKLGLRGVGMWNADSLNYSNPDEVKDMWGAIPRPL